MDRFMLYEWPGNVRELEHVLEGIISVGEGEQITVEDLPHYFDRIEPEEGLGLKEAIDRHERKIIERALLSCRGNVSQAAEILEVPRQTLQYKIKKYHL
jgi:arginine utilization regulatory protein